MKNIKYLLFLFSLIFMLGCEEEYESYTAPDELSDISWLLSIDEFSDDPFSLQADSFISFLDLSQGALEHKWEIEEGNNFLNEGFKKNDSLPLFINTEAGITIDEAKAHVLFRNSGLNKVRLYNTFKDSVTYRGTDRILQSHKEGDIWVIDTTFTFDIYGKLLPAFKVLKDGEEILNVTAEDLPNLSDSESWPEVEVESGASLTFVDLTTEDRPTGRTWLIPDGFPTQTGAEEATIKFYKLGTYLAGTLKSIRTLPQENVEKIIPLKVTVTQSTLPFEFVGPINEAEDESLSFRVSGLVEPFSGEEGNFTVNVTNSESGFIEDIPVQSARVNEDDATLIELTLTSPIYNSDIIKVSYNGGAIKSLDDRDLINFTNKNVNMYFGNNILVSNSWSSFEVHHAGLNRGYAGPNGAFWVGANGTEDDPNWSRTQNKASDGAASMQFSVDGIGKTYNLFTYGLGTIDKIPAGTYKVSLMVYLEAGNTMAGFWTWGEVPPLAQELWNLDGLPRGEWVKLEHLITTDALDAKKKVSITIRTNENPNASTGRQTMYLDNLSFIEVEVRP